MRGLCCRGKHGKLWKIRSSDAEWDSAVGSHQRTTAEDKCFMVRPLEDMLMLLLNLPLNMRLHKWAVCEPYVCPFGPARPLDDVQTNRPIQNTFQASLTCFSHNLFIRPNCMEPYSRLACAESGSPSCQNSKWYQNGFAWRTFSILIVLKLKLKKTGRLLWSAFIWKKRTFDLFGERRKQN